MVQALGARLVDANGTLYDQSRAAMLDKIDRKLLSLLQSDCTLSLQALADAVNLTTTPCWKRLKRLEDDGILLGRVALLDPEKLGLGLTAFVLIKTQHHSSVF
jgi:Lrp/AsnC family transcriptional regulator